MWWPFQRNKQTNTHHCIYIYIYIIYTYSYQTCKLIRVPYESNTECHVSKKRVQKTVPWSKSATHPIFIRTASMASTPVSQIFFSVESHLGLMTNYCHKLPKKSSRVQKTIPTLKEVFSSSEDNSSIGFSNGIKKSFHFQSYEKNRQPHCLQRNASTSSQENSPIAKSVSW